MHFKIVGKSFLEFHFTNYKSGGHVYQCSKNNLVCVVIWVFSGPVHLWLFESFEDECIRGYLSHLRTSDFKF